MEESATSGLSNEFDCWTFHFFKYGVWLLHYAFCWLQPSQVTTPNGKPSSAKVKVKRSNGTYKHHCHGHISMGKTHRKHMAKQPLEISSSNNSGNVGAQWCPTCLNRRWANLLSSATVMVCGTFDASIWSSDPCAHCIHHAPFSSWRVSPQWPLQLVAMWPASGGWDLIVTHLEATSPPPRRWRELILKLGSVLWRHLPPEWSSWVSKVWIQTWESLLKSNSTCFPDAFDL